MAKTLVDLYAFGNWTGPRPPRPGKDITPDAAGMVGPENPVRPFGASAVADVSKSRLHGHYHRLPTGTVLPTGLGVVADGSDILTGSRHGPSHHTIYPVVAMSFVKFVTLYVNLPWQYGGRK
jgi:hypothetical protein